MSKENTPRDESRNSLHKNADTMQQTEELTNAPGGGYTMEHKENPFMESLRRHFTEMKEGRISPRENYTHCMEILALMKDGTGELATTLETHYTIVGLRTVIKFADGRNYEIEIKEKK